MEKKTSSSVSLKNPHFFQPLLPGFNNHINIPVKFFSKYIEGIHEGKTVNLKSDFSNKTWKVKMEGKMLTEGWKEFVEAHDFRIGDFVVFRHEGDMLFNVTALGPSGCEIQYAQPPSREDSEESDESDSEISSESEKEVEENMKPEADPVSSDLNWFSQTVTASNLSRDQVNVPINFAKLNGFLNKERQEILLMNEEGKKWESEVRIFEASRLRIFRGWGSFCTENKLKVGDSCKFRLVRDKDTVVFQLCSRSNAERNRFVKLTPTLSSLNLGKQHLPVSFTRENGLTNPGKIVMVDKNRTEWLMNLNVDSRNTMYIMNGNAWKKFCAASEVSAGESLTLELVRGGTCPVLKFVSKMERSPSEAEGRPHKRARVEGFRQEGRLKHDVGKKIVEKGESSRPVLKFVSKMERSPSEAEAMPHKSAREERLNHDVGKKIFEKGESSRRNSAGEQGNLLQTQILSIVDELKKMKQRFEDELTSNRRFRAKLVTMEENLEAALLLL